MAVDEYGVGTMAAALAAIVDYAQDETAIRTCYRTGREPSGSTHARNLRRRGAVGAITLNETPGARAPRGLSGRKPIRRRVHPSLTVAAPGQHRVVKVIATFPTPGQVRAR